MHVPMVVLTSPEYRQAYPEGVAALRANRQKPVSCNAATFHTMLSLAGIDSPVLKAQKSLASKSYQCTERYYLNDHCEPVSITRLKLSDEDVAQFRRHKLNYK